MDLKPFMRQARYAASQGNLKQIFNETVKKATKTLFSVLSLKAVIYRVSLVETFGERIRRKSRLINKIEHGNLLKRQLFAVEWIHKIFFSVAAYELIKPLHLNDIVIALYWLRLTDRSGFSAVNKVWMAFKASFFHLFLFQNSILFL